MRTRSTLPVAALAGLVALCLAATGCGDTTGPAASPARTTTEAIDTGSVGRRTLGSAEAADFSLRDQHGRSIQLSAQRGKLVLLTFLYTSCPDVCPLIAENINRALRALGPKRDAVSVLAVSVDPAHDTPQAVRRFVGQHHLLPEFHYLTGTAADLKPIWQSYNLLVEVRSVERVAHSTYVLLIDRTGRPRLYYPSTVTATELTRDLMSMSKRGA